MQRHNAREKRLQGNRSGMQQPVSRQTPSIFVSYRTEDTAGYGRQLKNTLSDYFGEDQVFWAKDSIEIGDEFEDAIRRALSSCHILLAVIGKNWLKKPVDEISSKDW